MSDALPSLHQTITELFLIGDEILCQDHKEVFRVTEIHDNWVALSPAKGEGKNVRLDFSVLTAALGNTETEVDEKLSPLLHCIVSECRQRIEQAKRDAEVDDMWRSAMTCQL